MRYLPNLLTACGLICSLAGVLFLPLWPAWVLLGYGVLFDCLDGWAARKLDAATHVGAVFDWSVDVGIAYALAWRALPSGPALVAHATLLGVQVQTLDYGLKIGPRVSGRVFVTLGVFGWWLYSRLAA